MKPTKEQARIIKQGPCMICGGPYAAHRLIDTQMGRVAAGDDIGAVAREYETTIPKMVSTWLALLELVDKSYERVTL